jgi:chromosomal replication initiation ATPase DnaA
LGPGTIKLSHEGKAVTAAVISELEEVVTLVIHDGGTLAEALTAAFRAAGAEHHLEAENPAKPILRAACQHFQCSIGTLLVPSHAEIYTRRRYSTMVAMRMAGLKLKEIADALGYRDHCVVDHGLTKAKRRADIQRDGETIFAMVHGSEAARAA